MEITNRPALAHPAIFASWRCRQRRLRHHTRAHGQLFDSYEQAEYNASGLLQIHLKLLPGWSPFPWGSTFDQLDDNCLNEAFKIHNASFSVALPAGHTDWSVCFAGTTHYDLWDDDSNRKEVCDGKLLKF